MNLKAPVSTLMSSNLITVSVTDKLQVAKDIFGEKSLHHLPVLDEEEKLVGILSKTDYLYFIRPLDKDSNEPYLNDIRLKNYSIGEAMTSRVVSVSPNDSLESALEILTENIFHALPVLDGENLVQNGNIHRKLIVPISTIFHCPEVQYESHGLGRISRLVFVRSEPGFDLSNLLFQHVHSVLLLRISNHHHWVATSSD